MPVYYPVYLNLKGKRCLLFGGGRVAEGKILKLQDAGARISVISPEVTPVIRASAQSGDLEWHAREYQPGDLEGAFLGIAATNRRQVNRQIFLEAERLGVLLNVVDDPAQCTFIAPSIVQRGAVTLAISTGGASPALARKLREALSNHPALEWADLAGVLVQARKEVKKRGLPIDPQRWQCCLAPRLLELAQSGHEDEALATLLSSLLDPNTPDLCPRIDACSPQRCTSLPRQQDQ
jgi:siroheme synthase-like protein